MPIRKILTMGTMLRITPNSVHRHFETLLDASACAALVSDTEGVEAIRHIYINPRTSNSCRCQHHLGAKPRHRGSMPAFQEVSLQ